MQNNLYSHVLHESLVVRVKEIMHKRAARLSALQTRRQAEAYVRGVRSAIRRCFALPAVKTPLNARITGRLERKHYALEKVVYESRPGLPVTGNLYVPYGPSRPLPCVLGLCGHYDAGKAAEEYQSFCQGLAHKGFVVFIIDPIGQGERRQFYPGDGRPLPGLCHGHCLMGNQMRLVGDFFGTWRVWDAIRGLDYLLSRPEIDRGRVGVTGNSGGGTLTAYLTALDPRVTMAAPSCYICSYLANIQNEIPSDAEQNPPGALKLGLDQADLLLAYAPRPTMVLSQKYDFFDARYARQAWKDIRRIHHLLGARDSSAYFAGPSEHGFSKESREAMYAFFMEHAGLKGSAREPRINPEPAHTLFALKSGDIHKSGSRRVVEFTASAAQSLKGSRKILTRKSLEKVAAELLGVVSGTSVPFSRRIGFPDEIERKFMPRAQFALETDRNILTHVTVLGRKQFPHVPPTGPLDVFVGNETGVMELCVDRLGRSYLTANRSLAVIDPRGLGQTRAGSCHTHDFFCPYGSDFLYASTMDMLGESMLGRRVHDVCRTLDFLLAGGARDLRLIGRGMGAVIVAFVGLLHPSKPRVEIFNYLPSYQMLAESPIYKWPLSSLLRGVLLHFDLPDVYRSLGKRLKKTAPWNAMMQPVAKKQHR